MTNPDIISFTTNTALREAAARYGASIAIPCYLEGINGFADALLGETPDSTSTLVTCTSNFPESLAISIERGTK